MMNFSRTKASIIVKFTKLLLQKKEINKQFQRKFVNEYLVGRLRTQKVNMKDGSFGRARASEIYGSYEFTFPEPYISITLGT